MQRFNQLKLNLIERKDFLERRISKAIGEGKNSDAALIIARYEELSEILRDMCDMPMEPFFEPEERLSAPRHLKIVKNG